MKDKKQLHNLIILDESGSMEMIKEATIKGFHSLGDQITALSLEFKNQDYLVSLITFNGYGVKLKLFNQPIAELVTINESNYQPDSTTPLYDAICKSVLNLKHELYNLKNYGVLVTVITDGLENSSEEFTRKETKHLIETMSEDSRWGFGLIGANIDLEKTAQSLSIPLDRTIEFSHNDTSVSAMFNRYGKAQETMSRVFSCGGDFCDDIPF